MNPTCRLGVSPKMIPLRRIGRVSPSRFFRMQQCALRELFTASGVPTTLRESGRMLVGMLIHSLIESVGRGELAGVMEYELEALWETRLKEAESRVGGNWLQVRNLPLCDSVLDLEVQKIRTIKKCVEMLKSRRTRWDSSTKSEYEVWVESKDTLIGGYIDCVVEGHAGVVLRDYKSGMINIAEDLDIRIKPEYTVQMSMYAALYEECRGKWPVRLELVPLNGEVVTVPLQKDSAIQMLRSAKDLLSYVNSIVTSARNMTEVCDVLAAPFPETCFFCGYRPLCGPYKTNITIESAERWPADVLGQLMKLEEYDNGTIALSVLVGSKLKRVRGIEKNNKVHPALAFLQTGDTVELYALKKLRNTEELTESQYTTIYLG